MDELLDDNELEEVAGLLDDIDDEGQGLTDWEAEFIDRMLKRTEERQGLFLGQAKKIRQIHGERVK